MNSSSRIRVKVCGMTRPQDVSEAVDLGVDAIGMILHADSPRRIDTATAQAIRAQVPAFVSLVGVFVNAESTVINRAVADIGLDLVQLHGDEDAAFASRLKVPFIKAIRAKDPQFIDQAVEKFPGARALLLDSYVKGQRGGTGQLFDTTLWPKKATQKLILAGGLSADNIAAVCAAINPYAVDLNSGVEIEPGIKDTKLLADVLGIMRSL